MSIRVLQAIGQIGLTHRKEVNKVIARLFQMITRAKAFRAEGRHPNLKSTKKRIETSSVSNAWGVDTLLPNVPTRKQWWLESMERLKQPVRIVTMMIRRYHNWRSVVMIALKALWEVSSW